MHPALFKLMRMQFKGWFRRQLTGGSTRKLISAVIGTAMFLLWLSSVAMGAVLRKPKTPDAVLAELPLYLTGFALLPILFGGGDRAIAFSPAEIDFLFPGPFNRRQLVAYKLVKLGLGSLAGGLLFGLMLRSFAVTVAGGMLGAAMALLFINFMTTAVSLVRDTVEERYYTIVRRGAMLAVVAVVAVLAMTVRRAGMPTVEDVRRLTGTPAARVALGPARVFAHVFAAGSMGEMLAWAGACLLMVAGAVAVIFALDKGYMEAALVASQRRQARLVRMRGGVAVAPGKPVRSISVPQLSGLGPAGAIINKQLITALRTSRAWIIALVVAVGYGYFMSKAMAGADGKAGIAGLIPGLVMLLIMVPQMMRFDFRSDLDNLDRLKSLPAAPMAVAAAELAVPAGILGLMGWAIAGGVAVFMPVPARALIMAALAAPVVGLVAIALENFVFLLLPTRQLAPGQATTVFSGRRILMTLARLGLMVFGGGLVAGAGFAAWTISGSVGTTYAACWLALCGIAVGMVGAVAWAFARFDVSVDMPV